MKLLASILVSLVVFVSVSESALTKEKVCQKLTEQIVAVSRNINNIKWSVGTPGLYVKEGHCTEERPETYTVGALIDGQNIWTGSGLMQCSCHIKGTVSESGEVNIFPRKEVCKN